MKKTLALFALSAIALTACGGGSRQDFVDASVEMACGLTVQEMQNFDEAKMEERAKTIFGAHGFNIENEAEMNNIAESFDQDDELGEEIEGKITACMLEKLGGMEGMAEAFQDME